MIGIKIKEEIGIGDKLQYSSLPENYFKATGEKLVDISKPWFFDYNPYVIRDEAINLDKIVELWNFPKQYDWPQPRTKECYLNLRDEKVPGVYLSNAEIWASLFKVPVVLNRPRLYAFEDYKFSDRSYILLQTEGRSHGDMPEHIIKHVFDKYSNCDIIHIGPDRKSRFKDIHLVTEELWFLAEIISKAKMLIGMDSAPAWIAACYPDVIVKKVRTKPHPPERFKDWVPLEILNIHSHWDDRCHQIFNVTENDIGFTSSYLKI